MEVTAEREGASALALERLERCGGLEQLSADPPGADDSQYSGPGRCSRSSATFTHGAPASGSAEPSVTLGWMNT
jgi:hypothetical protein